MIPQVAAQLGASLAVYQALDTVPVPLARRCRGEKHRLFGWETAIGHGGSDNDWYYGCQLLLPVTNDGLITGFTLAPADTDDRWVAESLLCWRQDPQATPWGPAQLPPSHKKGGKHVGPTGPIWPRASAGVPTSALYIADGGFFGQAWQTHWHRDYQAAVLTGGDLRNQENRAAKRQFSGWRQIVETINAALDGVFHLGFPGARSPRGVLVRVAAKILALDLGIWLNRAFGRKDLAFATLFAS